MLWTSHPETALQLLPDLPIFGSFHKKFVRRSYRLGLTNFLLQAAQDCQTCGEFSAVSGCDVHMEQTLQNRHSKSGRICQSKPSFPRNLLGVASATPHKFLGDGANLLRQITPRVLTPRWPIFEDSEGSKYAAVYLLPSDAEYMLVIYCQTCGDFSAGFVMFVP